MSLETTFLDGSQRGGGGGDARKECFLEVLLQNTTVGKRTNCKVLSVCFAFRDKEGCWSNYKEARLKRSASSHL